MERLLISRSVSDISGGQMSYKENMFLQLWCLAAVLIIPDQDWMCSLLRRSWVNMMSLSHTTSTWQQGTYVLQQADWEPENKQDVQTNLHVHPLPVTYMGTLACVSLKEVLEPQTWQKTAGWCWFADFCYPGHSFYIRIPCSSCWEVSQKMNFTPFNITERSGSLLLDV